MHSKNRQPDPNSIFFQESPETPIGKPTEQQSAMPEFRPAERAILYCEGHFDQASGKITSDLLRHSERYKFVSVIDDESAGQDSGKALKRDPNQIPIFRNLGTALAQAGRVPMYFVCGFTPVDRDLSEPEKRVLLRAIGYGMNIACELHESLNADEEFSDAAAKKGVVIEGI